MPKKHSEQPEVIVEDKQESEEQPKGGPKRHPVTGAFLPASYEIRPGVTRVDN